MELQEMLRIARAAKKMKQHEVAEAVGVEQQSVSEWEKGGGIRSDYWDKIQEVLGVDVKSFYTKGIDADNAKGSVLGSSYSPIVRADNCVSVNVQNGTGGRPEVKLPPELINFCLEFQKYGNAALLGKFMAKLDDVKKATE